MPVLAGDNKAAWDKDVLADRRVTQLWDGRQLFGSWLQAHGGALWDTFLVYGPNARWRNTPTRPLASGSPIIGATDALERALLPLIGNRQTLDVKLPRYSAGCDLGNAYAAPYPASHMPERHLKAAQTHDHMALRHEAAALYWDEYGDPEHAQLERRNVEIERAAAQLERDRADFILRKRAASTA